MQNSLNKFFQQINNLAELPTASAYCQARDKIKPEIFKEMNLSAVSDFYRLHNTKTWKSRRLLSVDGSKINFPNTEELRNKYKLINNNSTDYVQGLSSFMYDVLNEVTLNSELDTIKPEKDFLLNDHIKFIEKTDIILLDRGYADYSVLSGLITKNIDFVSRFPISQSFKELNNFVLSSEVDKVLMLKVTTKQKKYVAENNLNTEIKVRFVKVDLLDKVEILATTLFDESIEELKYLYGCRWGIETYFDRLKNIFELERFSGKKLNNIEQDFYGIFFLTNLESILIKDSQEILSKETRNRDFEYKINRSVSYSSIIDYIIELFFNSNFSDKQILKNLEKLFRTNPIIIRPNRTYERKKISHARKLRVTLYEKRVPS